MQNINYGVLNFRIYAISLLLFSGLNMIFDFRLYHLLYFIGVLSCLIKVFFIEDDINE